VLKIFLVLQKEAVPYP